PLSPTRRRQHHITAAHQRRWEWEVIHDGCTETRPGTRPGRGQAQPVPYTRFAGRLPLRSRVRAGLAPALVLARHASVVALVLARHASVVALGKGAFVWMITNP